MSETPIFDSMENEPEREPERTTSPNKIQPKVVASTVGAGVGSALATVITWIVSIATHVEVPETVELAVGVILTAGLAFVGGFWKRG